MKEQNFNMIIAGQQEFNARWRLMSGNVRAMKTRAKLERGKSLSGFERTQIDLIDEGFVRWVGIEGVDFN